jgi:anaerobic dimethyl sulfoxide reductase subunit C (anchor subunit)
VKNISSEWSLIAFSFLTMLSVSTLVISFIRGVDPDKFMLFSMLFLALISSLLHLGRPSGAFRALLNIRKSPLSLEIALFILFSGLALISVLSRLPGVFIAASAAGIALLISIDRVYTFADKRISVYLHSGQTFLSALLAISFFTGNILTFIFIGSLRLISSVYSLTTDNSSDIFFGLRFFRISLLLIAAASLITGISNHENLTILIFLAGELLDRILFYIDFNPLNINTLIDSHFNSARDEKKRG